MKKFDHSNTNTAAAAATQPLAVSASSAAAVSSSSSDSKSRQILVGLQEYLFAWNFGSATVVSSDARIRFKSQFPSIESILRFCLSLLESQLFSSALSCSTPGCSSAVQRFAHCAFHQPQFRVRGHSFQLVHQAASADSASLGDIQPILFTEEFLYFLQLIFETQEFDNHARAARLMWFILTSAAQADSSPASPAPSISGVDKFLHFIRSWCSGQNFSDPLKNVLFAILTQETEAIIQQADSITSIHFHVSIRHPALLGVIFDCLRYSPLEVRRLALQDLNSLLHQSQTNFQYFTHPNNIKDICSSVFHLLVDLRKSAIRLEPTKSIYALSLHLLVSILFHYFFKTDHFLAIFNGVLEKLHHLADYSQDSSQLASTLIFSLCSKLASMKNNFSTDNYSTVEWKNLLQLANFVKWFVFRTPHWKSETINYSNTNNTSNNNNNANINNSTINSMITNGNAMTNEIAYSNPSSFSMGNSSLLSNLSSSIGSGAGIMSVAGGVSLLLLNSPKSNGGGSAIVSPAAIKQNPPAREFYSRDDQSLADPIDHRSQSQTPPVHQRNPSAMNSSTPRTSSHRAQQYHIVGRARASPTSMDPPSGQNSHSGSINSTTSASAIFLPSSNHQLRAISANSISADSDSSPSSSPFWSEFPSLSASTSSIPEFSTRERGSNSNQLPAFYPAATPTPVPVIQANAAGILNESSINQPGSLASAIGSLILGGIEETEFNPIKPVNLTFHSRNDSAATAISGPSGLAAALNKRNAENQTNSAADNNRAQQNQTNGFSKTRSSLKSDEADNRSREQKQKSPTSQDNSRGSTKFEDFSQSFFQSQISDSNSTNSVELILPLSPVGGSGKSFISYFRADEFSSFDEHFGVHWNNSGVANDARLIDSLIALFHALGLSKFDPSHFPSLNRSDKEFLHAAEREAAFWLDAQQLLTLLHENTIEKFKLMDKRKFGKTIRNFATAKSSKERANSIKLFEQIWIDMGANMGAIGESME